MACNYTKYYFDAAFGMELSNYVEKERTHLKCNHNHVKSNCLRNYNFSKLTLLFMRPKAMHFHTNYQ